MFIFGGYDWRMIEEPETVKREFGSWVVPHWNVTESDTLYVHEFDHNGITKWCVFVWNRLGVVLEYKEMAEKLISAPVRNHPPDIEKVLETLIHGF